MVQCVAVCMAAVYVLQCGAVCCSVVQCVAVQCSVYDMRCTRCSVLLQCVGFLQCVAVCMA